MAHLKNMYQWMPSCCFTINCIEKSKIKKEAGIGPYFKKKHVGMSSRRFTFNRTNNYGNKSFPLQLIFAFFEIVSSVTR